MTRNPAKVLSASRRTDIPAFYLEWFMEHIRLGFFNIINPYNRVKTILDLNGSSIHSIVFWSKNFGPFLRSDAGPDLQKRGYNLYFNFTINSESALLEKNLPPLDDRLGQLERLAGIYGAETIAWRFDPICFYRTSPLGPLENNLEDFNRISEQAGQLGIPKCVTSFCDLYTKIKKRTDFLFENKTSKVIFENPDKGKKIRIIKRMEKHLQKFGVDLFLCCEKELFEQLDELTRVRQNACIDGSVLKKIFGGNPETRRDYGQRSKTGCQCSKSVDIGSYQAHPCQHNCLFCYANPEIDTRIKKANVQ